MCKTVLMPNIDEEARRWELDLAGRVGRAVSARRKKLRMTAVVLADRTKELGYPITRVTISKIENNARAGKIDVAELLVLAVALEIPPALLLFPDFPDGKAEVLPGIEASGEAAVRWLSGLSILNHETPAQYQETRKGKPLNNLYWGNRLNAGTDLVEVVNESRELAESQLRWQRLIDENDPNHRDNAARIMEYNQERLDQLANRFDVLMLEVWGDEESDDE